MQNNTQPSHSENPSIATIILIPVAGAPLLWGLLIFVPHFIFQNLFGVDLTQNHHFTDTYAGLLAPLATLVCILFALAEAINLRSAISMREAEAQRDAINLETERRRLDQEELRKIHAIDDARADARAAYPDHIDLKALRDRVGWNDELDEKDLSRLLSQERFDSFEALLYPPDVVVQIPISEAVPASLNLYELERVKTLENHQHFVQARALRAQYKAEEREWERKQEQLRQVEAAERAALEQRLSKQKTVSIDDLRKRPVWRQDMAGPEH